MTLIAGRMPTSYSLDSSAYREDSNMPGILKSGPTHRPSRRCVSYMEKPAETNNRNEDGKRLVRFSETEKREEHDRREDIVEEDDSDIIMLGSNMYLANNPDPNSAVRKLFPNSKLKPINPFLNKQPKPIDVIKTTKLTLKSNEDVYNIVNQRRSKSVNELSGGNTFARKKIDNTIRRNMPKVQADMKTSSGKLKEKVTPLMERIKQLTSFDGENDLSVADTKKDSNEKHHDSGRYPENGQSINCVRKYSNHNVEQSKHLPKFEALNLTENISKMRSHINSVEKQLSPTDEARRSFLSSLSQHQQGDPGDRTSVATVSTTTDTVYSISDIEEALTEEEKEIREAFAEEIKQDELELFVQQDATRTERLRKRYSTTPKTENSNPMLSSSSYYPQANFTAHNSVNTMKREKPKFGSTIEILQQLQQQIESPYQLEGRRTACSNYSDSSIPISDRLFYDESSDSYEPIPKLNVQRTFSLDSKNYEEIDNYPPYFGLSRTKSQEHPRMTHFDADIHIYAAPSVKYQSHFVGGNHFLEQNLYTSSPDLHSSNRNNRCPERFASNTNLQVPGRQLHPILQKQYCRYPEAQKAVDDIKVLTPPSRMHTYMNVPTNAPCYLSPPPYSKTHFVDSPSCPDRIYQNIPVGHHYTTSQRRLNIDKERGVPEGARYPEDCRDFYSPTYPSKDCYLRPLPTISSLPHKYCVNV